MKKGLLLIALIGLGIAGIWQTAAAQADRQAEQPVVVDDATQSLLSTTVQILMYRPNQPQGAEAAGSSDEYRMVDGIGTLQLKQGQAWLVTHNHWDEYLSQGVLVQLKDAGGKLLSALEMGQFRRLIRYQDEGTLMLKLSPELEAALAPVNTNMETMTMSPSEREVQVGDIVQVSYRPAEARETLGVRDAQVTAISQYGGARTMQLSTVNGHPILKGDSGGGIWFEGRLVGNMWASFYDAATDTPTANGFAAFLPFGQV